MGLGHPNNSDIYIRPMRESDIDYFADAFNKLNWGDRRATLESYFTQQALQEREVLVAAISHEVGTHLPPAMGVPAGYVTLVPNATRGPFANMNIPEIMDFNVLPQYRRMGIGGRLMDDIEAIAKTKCNQVTLGVGMYPAYGTAQRMYVKRGYIPDGTGLWHGNKNLDPYEDCVNDDDLNLYFIKKL